MYDIEVYADRFEQEQAYALEWNMEMAFQAGASEQRISDMEKQAADLLERMDAQLELVNAMASSLKAPLEQTEEETCMFEEWLS